MIFYFCYNVTKVFLNERIKLNKNQPNVNKANIGSSRQLVHYTNENVFRVNTAQCAMVT